MQPTLTQLANRYHTDKAFFYAPYYDLLLKGRNIKRILEIGVGSYETMKDSISRAGWTDYYPGASLMMWKMYFPDAQVYSMDHNEDLKPTWLFDQSHPDSYPHFDGFYFDLIVEDGSHRQADQLLAREKLIPALAPHGLYITEDIADPDNWPYPTITFKNQYGKATLSIYGD